MTDLFLVPGFSQTAGAWSGVRAALAGTTTVHALDIPICDTLEMTASTMAQQGRGVWVGYSMGGRLALSIALQRPEVVDALVLVSANPGIEDPQEQAARRRADEQLAQLVELHGIEWFLRRWLAQPLFAGLDPQEGRRHRLESPSEIAHQLRTLGQGAHAPMWDRVAELTMPVVVVAGDRDEKYRTIAHRLVGSIGPHASLHLVPGAGHALLQEAPLELAEIISAR